MKKRCMGCMEEMLDGVTVCPYCGYVEGTPAKEAYHIVPGTILRKRYIIGKVLGFGGFGITYLGYDTVLCIKVAIKEYLPSEFSTRVPNQTQVTVYSGEKAAQFASGMEKFLEEARKLAQFQREKEIIHVFDCFEANDTAYILMEYLDGESLKERLERVGTIPVSEAVSVILTVLDGLKKIHKEGMLHRDIAPDNIYLTKDGRVKIMDFGAARYAAVTHTRSLTVMMKPGYSPIEQYQSKGNQGPWTDVYATAATLYRMITGITPDESLKREIKDTIKRPSKLKIPIEKSQETALMNALVIAPEKRTQTAEEFSRQLLAAQVDAIKIKKKKDWFFIAKLLLFAAAGAVAASLVFLAVRASSLVVPQWVQEEIPEGQVRVPNFVNDTIESAMARGEEVGLTVQITDKEYSNEIQEGRILSQSLKKGSIQEKGSTVNVAISAGIEKTLVPEVIGLMKEDAEKILFDAGFKVTYQEEESWVAPGAVISQSLDAALSADTGTEMTVIVSKGVSGGDAGKKLVLPDVIQMEYEEAGAYLIQNFVYLLRKEAVYDTQVPKGCIISQEPQAGTEVSQTSSVKVVVSLGKEQVLVPDVQYKTREEAVQMLEAVGLLCEIGEESSREVASGNVIRQEIEANTMTDKGNTVRVIISTGPPQQVQQTQPATTAPARTQPRTTVAATAPPVTEPTTTIPPQTEAQTQAQTTSVQQENSQPAEDDGMSDMQKLNKALKDNGL